MFNYKILFFVAVLCLLTSQTGTYKNILTCHICIATNIEEALQKQMYFPLTFLLPLFYSRQRWFLWLSLRATNMHPQMRATRIPGRYLSRTPERCLRMPQQKRRTGKHRQHLLKGANNIQDDQTNL